MDPAMRMQITIELDLSAIQRIVAFWIHESPLVDEPEEEIRQGLDSWYPRKRELVSRLREWLMAHEGWQEFATIEWVSQVDETIWKIAGGYAASIPRTGPR